MTAGNGGTFSPVSNGCREVVGRSSIFYPYTHGAWKSGVANSRALVPHRVQPAVCEWRIIVTAALSGGAKGSNFSFRKPLERP